MDKSTKHPHENDFFTNAEAHNGRIDFYQILHIHSLGERNDIFESPSKTLPKAIFTLTLTHPNWLRSFGRVVVHNLGSPIDFDIGF